MNDRVEESKAGERWLNVTVGRYRHTKSFKYAYTDGEQATALASSVLDAPWNGSNTFFDVMPARDKRDKYAFKTAGLSLARQNGKS